MTEGNGRPTRISRKPRQFWGRPLRLNLTIAVEDDRNFRQIAYELGQNNSQFLSTLLKVYIAARASQVRP